MSKSPTTTKTKLSIPRDPNRRPPPMHPGEILREEFVLPNGLTANALALALRVPATRVSEILRERRSITVETAYRLAIYFGTSVELWTNLQTSYELALVEQEKLERIKKEVHRRSA